MNDGWLNAQRVRRPRSALDGNDKPSKDEMKASVNDEEPSTTATDAEPQPPTPISIVPPVISEPVPQADLEQEPIAPTQEPIGALLVRLLGLGHPAYPSERSKRDAINKLAGFDADEHLRVALEWALTIDGAEWGYELKDNTMSPHCRLAKVRDRVVQEYRTANKPLTPRKRVRRPVHFGNPVSLERLHQIAEEARAKKTAVAV